MTIWIAVAFFCVKGECSFWKADQVFHSQEQCEAKLIKLIDIDKSVVDGVCLPVKVNAI